MFFVFELLGKESISWDNLQFAFLCSSALMIVMILWSLKDLKGFSNSSTEYFRLLGFEKPSLVNLNYPYFSEMLDKDGEGAPEEWWNMCEYQYRNMFSVRAAIKAGTAKLISPKRAKKK
jgi:hypothetical protein